ncbi:LANO_0G08834g1_1 [Lachancea nothofagi CBS 11611]|uniref:LANO_0G08834g1_1 n=1 Tax=Lachancea nothofagi CBS 11611 TaxID=1266666 RepID=A0A1G4KI34_9SACH|nr:LANO_0G08834g1_1 [Lachancea nothofagi CBS 11611]
MRANTVFLLFHFGVVLTESVRMPLPQPQLSFLCPPIKASRVNSRNWKEQATCINFKATQDRKPAAFTLKVSDFLDYKLDLNRFGPTSCEKGKQSLDFTVTSQNGDLLRSRHNLKSGRTAIQLTSATPDSHFLFCFINLVYDGSWKSIDMHKEITLTLINHETARPRLTEQITINACDSVVDSANILFSLVNESEGQELFQLEQERRDISENTFSWLFRFQSLLLITLSMANIMVIYYLRSHRKPAGPLNDKSS